MSMVDEIEIKLAIIKRQRRRNTKQWFLSLVDIGGICLVLAIYASPDIWSDLLVNLSAGFLSAAILTLVIERVYASRQDQNEQDLSFHQRLQKIAFYNERTNDATRRIKEATTAMNKLHDEKDELLQIMTNLKPSTTIEAAEVALKTMGKIIELENQQMVMAEDTDNIIRLGLNFMERATSRLEEVYEWYVLNGGLAAPEEVEEFELSAINAKLNADKALTAYRSSLKNTEDLKKGNEESKIKYNQLVETVAQLKSVTASR